MRLYISGAISGTTDYIERFSNAERKLYEQGYTVINPARVCNALPESAFSHEEYMKIDLALLDMCDGIYMLQGWEKSCGANRELGYALGKDKAVMYE